MTGVLLNGLPAPSLQPIRERGRTVAVIDLAGRLYLPVGGTGTPSDLGPLFSAAKNPPGEIVKCDGQQFFPVEWIEARGLFGVAELAARVQAMRALAGSPVA